MQSGSGRPHHSHLVGSKIFGISSFEIGKESFEPHAVIGGFLAECVAAQDATKMIVDANLQKDFHKPSLFLYRPHGLACSR